MGRTSLYFKKEVVHNGPARKIDYQKIYDLVDQGYKPKFIINDLEISEGSYYHAINVRKRSNDGRNNISETAQVGIREPDQNLNREPKNRKRGKGSDRNNSRKKWEAGTYKNIRRDDG